MSELASAPPLADALLVDIADYVASTEPFASPVYDTAHLCLIDSLGCALLALNYPACTSLMGPIVQGATLPGGARVPGTSTQLDPVQAAFNLGSMIRWLDYNDTWLAAEWGHPSDNLGGILATADYLSRQRSATGQPPVLVRGVLTAMIRAHEIQGVLAMENSFNRLGLDHVILVRVASAAVAAELLGGTRQQIIAAVSNAWIDGGSLRTYRHAPDTGPRKSWAAGDATSRGVWHALMAMRGEPGYPSTLTTPTWGFQDALNRGKPLVLSRPLASYVMENILFKISYPAEFHAQTAVEAAIRLHPEVNGRLDDIRRVQIETQESALRIIDKRGPLRNPADRDHCLQYMVAVGLIHGTLEADHYEEETARDPRIDRLRATMDVVESPQYSRDYLDPEKRSVANAVQVFFTDGTMTERVQIEYPVGHRRRRAEGIPLLWRKFEANLRTRLPTERVESVLDQCRERSNIEQMPVHAFVDLFS